MPWQSPGVTPQRTWVYAPSPGLLKARWNRLISVPERARAELFKETHDRQADTTIPPIAPFLRQSKTLAKEDGHCPGTVRIGYRAFDRQYLIPDARVIDRPRPGLWQVASNHQIFVIEQHDEPTTVGPGLVFTSDVPDKHLFRGRGGRALPLYRDPGGLASNTAPGLLSLIARRTGMNPAPEDFLSYLAGVTAHPAYTERFAAELKNPGIRVPLTADPVLWAEAVAIGEEVLWLHTYGERYSDPAKGRELGAPKLPQGQRPKVIATIPDTADDMPETITYDEATKTLHIGRGQIRPVSPAAWTYETSGMRIVRHWFAYRKKNRAGRRSSSLDDINANHWPSRYTTCFLELLNVLEMCIDLEPRQTDLLARICDGPLITVSDLKQEGILPVPPSHRKPLPPDSADAPTLL